MVPGELSGWFDVGGPSRISRLIYKLLKRKDAQARYVFLADAFSSGHALGTQQWLLARLAEESKKQFEGGGNDALFSSEDVEDLKKRWLINVADRADTLANHLQLGRIVHAWWAWGDQARVREWCQQLVASDEGLLAFLPNFVTYSRSQTVGDYAVKVQPRLNPSWIEDYININEIAERLRELIKSDRIMDKRQNEAATQFLREIELIAAGKNPDGPWAFEDYDEKT